MKTPIHSSNIITEKPSACFLNQNRRFAACLGVVLSMLASAISARADALTGFYTQIAVGDPDFGGGTNAGWILGTGMVADQLGPNGLPVLSASGIARLGTDSDMNSTTHELLWWSAGANPYVSLDSQPVQINSMPFSYGYPNVNWYPTGQTGDNNFYRAVHWQGTFKMATAGSVSLNLAVDDDAWLFIDGTLVAEDHYGYTSDMSIPVSSGTHSIDLFYDDRFQIYDAVQFSFSVPISAVEPVMASFESLIGMVRGLVQQGALSRSDGNQLIARLEVALRSSNHGRRSGFACNQVAKFTERVQALVNRGRLTSTQGQTLTDAASELQFALGCPQSGNGKTQNALAENLVH
jgi:hypothetical protein